MSEDNFKYVSEQFADLKILRYQVPNFENLSIKQKKFAYYLSEAALFGREIIIDQNYKNNIKIKRILEDIYLNYKGDKNSLKFQYLVTYLKRVWFSNGIHHHYSTEKFLPEFSEEEFKELAKNSDTTVSEDITDIIFNPQRDAKRVCLDTNKDMITSSANNFYEGVTQKEAEAYYQEKYKTEDKKLALGLNSRLVKKDGKIYEETAKSGGKYTQAIEKIIYYLECAREEAETELQEKWLDRLIAFYKTGSLKEYNQYNINWVKDSEPTIDTINGFTEVYGDPLGMHGAWEALVLINDKEKSEKIKALSRNAAWFEQNSPISPAYKRKDNEGMAINAINVLCMAGDSSPSSPIGINLPNAEWIREEYGSKSVTLDNLIDAYNQASKQSGSIDEFNIPEKAQRIKKFSKEESSLFTAMHEIIGHGSGQLAENVKSPAESLKNYANTIEEMRADLVALYFLPDKFLVEKKISSDTEIGKAAYDSYITNGIMGQISRIPKGGKLEEAHMRNRQAIAKWAYKTGYNEKVIERITRDEKTFFVVNDYDKLREIFGQQLKEIQRIKSEGDYEAAKNIVEKYGINIEEKLHEEILVRFKKLNIAPYAGFINPKLTPVFKGNEIIDVNIEYPEDFSEQMLYYKDKYSVL